MEPASIQEKEIIRFLTPRQALSALWDKGLKGRRLLEHHSSLIDGFIQDRFNEAIREGRQAPVALVALGGYGRQELFPFSDIDLLLLYSPESERIIEAVTDAVFYPLWDAGLDVGHGVRTIEQCLEDIEEDFFFQVALLDARFLCGDRGLFARLQERFRAWFSQGRRRRFAEDMMAHRLERHKRFGDHTYMLEPNIKESRGGLRDLQGMLWTAQVLFGLRGLSRFQAEGLMTSQEAAQVREATDQLIIVRNRLHYVSGRKNDRLYFEYQEEIAKALRHYDSQGLMGVERFMRSVHKALKTISIASDMFFEHVSEVISAKGPGGPRVKDLGGGITQVDGKVGLRDAESIRAKPWAVFRAFALAAKQGCGLHFRARRLISELVPELKEKWLGSKRCANYFFQVLENAQGPEILEQMLDCGLLTAFIPEMEHLRYLALHDIYHVNTVDRHSLETVANINRLKSREPEVFMEIEAPHVLRLAGLLHDVGKGRGGRHAEKGAKLVQEIGPRLGLSQAETECLSFLVRQHLFMMDTATRRDLEDESLILKCARTIGTLDRLNMLYILSVADALATGPNAWNEWKAALILELYHKIAHLIEQTDLIDPDRVAAVDWMKQQVRQRLGKEADEYLSLLPEDYLLSFTPEAILHHLELSKALAGRKVICVPENRGDYWSILLITKDRTGLLAKICGTFALYSLDILQANIFTLKNGIVVDVLDVRSMVNSSFDDVDWKGLERDLLLAIDNRLGLSHRLAAKYRRPGSAARPKIAKQPKVVIDNQMSDFYTIIEIYAEESPCLLYSVTKTLADFSINIFKAKIGSSADQVVDVFYVLDSLGQRIEDEGFKREVEQALLYASQACLF
jgi:[protein-PII] uridylyltransferase